VSHRAATVQVLRDGEAIARALAETFTRTASESILERGSFSVALSGGNTPRAAYRLLSRERSQLDWGKVFVYFGDERCVPPDDPASNYRMAREAFLDAVPIPSVNVFRMAGEIDPGMAANEYASKLRAGLGNVPHFDLVLLGLGEDGHTASLFPGTAPDVDGTSLVRAVYAQAQEMWRITITPPVINAARSVVFAVEGAAKALAVAAVLEGPHDPVALPAQIVQPKSGPPIWLVDEAAASLLHEVSG
jgi:6-phosphogluconolactonase